MEKIKSEKVGRFITVVSDDAERNIRLMHIEVSILTPKQKMKEKEEIINFVSSLL